MLCLRAIVCCCLCVYLCVGVLELCVFAFVCVALCCCGVVNEYVCVCECGVCGVCCLDVLL